MVMVDKACIFSPFFPLLHTPWFLQVAGGVWADTYGGKQVLGFGVVWWSLATVLTPFAAQLGLPALLFARACMGVGEVSERAP